MVSITSASTFTIGRSCWSTPESAFERAKHLGGAGSGLVSLARHCLDDEAAVAIQPTFSGKTKLEASGNSFQASRCQSGRLLVMGDAQTGNGMWSLDRMIVTGRNSSQRVNENEVTPRWLRRLALCFLCRQDLCFYRVFAHIPALVPKLHSPG